MTSLDEPPLSGRFGAATPGARPSPPSLEALLAAPQAPRRRLTPRRILAAAGILVVAAGGYAAGHYTWTTPPPAVSQRVVTGAALPAGAQLTGADLRVVTVRPGGGVPAGTRSPAAAARLVGLVTRTAIPAGAFLERSLLAPSGAIPGPAQALVGLALKPGQLPAAGLAAGEQVLVIALPVSSAGTALSPVPFLTTTVWYLQGPDSSGNADATIIVPARLETVLAGYAARGEIALVATGQSGAAPAPAGAAPAPATVTPKPARARRARLRTKKTGSAS
ncbi:MAG: hypothetical protein ACLPN6_21950 [Streptosporangiaceae bacterium]